MPEARPPNLRPGRRGAGDHAGRRDVRRRLADPRHGGRARRRHASHLARGRGERDPDTLLPGGPGHLLAGPAGGGPVTPTPALSGAIIAAGDGSRLRRAGWTVPKPLVPVAFVPRASPRSASS